jgi:hypothetical protein
LVEGGKCGCHVVGRLVKVGRGFDPAGGELGNHHFPYIIRDGE